jgi:hypothetical protein
VDIPDKLEQEEEARRLVMCRRETAERHWPAAECDAQQLHPHLRQLDRWVEACSTVPAVLSGWA